MNIEVLNLILTVALVLVYLYVLSMMIRPVLHRISIPMTPATGMLFLGALLGAGLVLYQFSDISTNALYFYASRSDYAAGIGYQLLFSAIALISCYVLFLASFFVMNFFTPENEKAELSKNNFVLAGQHVVVYVIICLLVSKPLAHLVNAMIDYPTMPD